MAPTRDTPTNQPDSGHRETVVPFLRGPHTVLGTSILPPFPDGVEVLYLGMGCFWGAERIFWELPGVYTTAVGYIGGVTQHPTYEAVCSGTTGHTEAVLVAFHPDELPIESVLAAFWEGHDPTQGNRQGNDVGTQYRSAVFVTNDTQISVVEDSKSAYQHSLTDAGFDVITTQIGRGAEFFYAEEYHQQYLDKNPNGYCGIGGTGVACPIRPE